MCPTKENAFLSADNMKPPQDFEQIRKFPAGLQWLEQVHHLPNDPFYNQWLKEYFASSINLSIGSMENTHMHTLSTSLIFKTVSIPF